jgi:hypothetical protein
VTLTTRLAVQWAALALASASVVGAQQPAHDNRAAIRADDIKRDLFEMASDDFRGREAGTLDEMRASMWVADMARKAGLAPAGELGSYFQWWGMRRNRVASSSTVAVGDRTFTLWTEAIVNGVAEGKAQGPVVWVASATAQELDAMDLKGKVVAANITTPANAPGSNVSLRAWRYSRLAIAQRGNALVQRGAAAVILVADSTVESAWDFQSVVSARGTYGLDSVGAILRPRVAPPVIVVRPELAETVRRPGATATIDIRSESFVYPSVNIVARVTGTDPKLRDEYVLFSSHQDHDGVRSVINGDSIWNGADDNATGSVSLLAIARAFAKQPGKRSALFVWHGAEERGLLGSRWHAEHPMVPKAQIVAVLNAEMMGRNSPDSATLMGVQPPHRNSIALVNMALQANNETAKFLLDSLWDRPSHPEGWYFRSDHLPYARAGIPAVMYSSNLHPDYHTPRDEAATIDIAKLTKMTLWIYRTGWLVANAKDRPAVDPGFKLER